MNTSAILRMMLLGVSLPLAAALAFTFMYSIPLAITDEWHFIEAVIRMERAATWREWLSAYVTDHHGHKVPVAFAVYLLVEYLTNFDSRSLIFVTMSTYVAQVFIFSRALNFNWIATLPIAILYFSPSHYYDFLWGFMFTVALATFLAVMALFTLSFKPVTWPRYLGALCLSEAATLSSANGLFAFPALVTLLALKLESNRQRTAIMICAAIAAAGLNYLLLYSGTGSGRTISVVLLGTMTAFGAAVTDSPWAIRTFALDGYSILGAAILSGGAAAFFFALRTQRLPLVAFPLSLVTFSLLSMSSVMVARGEFGNWLLQLTLPGIAGSYLALVLLGTREAIPRSVPVAYAAILITSLVGYWAGFTVRGPVWLNYAAGIAKYARSFEEQPGQPAPFPGPYFIHKDLLDFWKKRGLL